VCNFVFIRNSDVEIASRACWHGCIRPKQSPKKCKYNLWNLKHHEIRKYDYTLHAVSAEVWRRLERDTGTCARHSVYCCCCRMGRYMNEFKFKSAYPLTCNCDWIAPTVSSRRWLNSSSYKELYSLVSKSVCTKAPSNAVRLWKRPLVSPHRAHDYKIVAAYVGFKKINQN